MSLGTLLVIIIVIALLGGFGELGRRERGRPLWSGHIQPPKSSK
jgi:hypothetical protein